MTSGKSEKSSYNLFELYLISKNLSQEILMDEHLQSRGIYHSVLSESYAEKKTQFKRKVILTKIFYAIIFGVLPVIPVLAYFEYLNILISGAYEFEFVIFSISMFYGVFFSLQFLNFLLMTIMETTVILSGQSLTWFKTLPISNKSLKRMVYITVFRNFDIPIIVITFAFPVSLLIVSANFFFFFMLLGISIINTFLGINIVIIISKRLNRILNLNDVSSKKTFLIRLFNVFSYVFIILGSIYLIQWTSTSIGEIFELFIASELPNLINIIMSTVPYPFSQSYLIALMFSPTYIETPIFFSTLIGMGLLIVILFLSFIGAIKSINNMILSEPLYKQKAIFLENIKENFKIKTQSTFKAFLKKDLLSSSRDLKSFLSLISPIIFSFIFVTYLNLPSVSVSDPIDFQILKVWVSYLLLTPILSGIIVFSLLNLDASGQSILESLPLIPREQAKAKLFIMLTVLSLSIILPCFLFITNPRFFIFFFGIIACLPFAWIFLFLSFEMSIYFFGKRYKNYIVTDLSAKSIFIWIVVLIIPLSICFWIISISTLLFLHAHPFELYFSVFISLLLIMATIFNFLFYDKLFPLKRFKEVQGSDSKAIFRKITNPTFFTEHVWISVATLLILDFMFNFILLFITSILRSIIPQPIVWFYNISVIDFLLDFAYYYAPLILSNIIFILIYFILIPKRFGIPYGRKPTGQFLNDTGLSWIKPIYKNLRYIIFGLIAIILMFLFLGSEWYSFYYVIEFSYIITLINTGFWIEIAYRGLILNILRIKYKDSVAILLHLAIIFVYFYLFPVVLSYPMMYVNDFFIMFNQFLLSMIMILGFHFIMDFIFIKADSLTPNFVITILFIVLFFPISTPFYRMI